MITPPYLQKGDTVAIVSPAKKITESEIKFAIDFLQKKGLKVVLGKYVFGTWNRFSGTDKERSEDFQRAIDDPNVKAVFCARGGYGCVRIVDKLNYSNLLNNPKWLIGYSDVTVFHNHFNTNLELKTIHGPMPLNIVEKNEELRSAERLLSMLFGENREIKFGSHRLNLNGKTSGKMIGGNLSVLCGLIGTDADISTKGSILFLEDLCEENYKLDRMLFQLKKSGKFEHLAGLLIGGFTEMTDLSNWFESNSLELIAKHTEKLDIPIAFNFPAGHTPVNTPLILGQEYYLEVKNSGSLLKPV